MTPSPSTPGTASSSLPPSGKGSGVEYRDIEGWPGYRVGSDGSVWSRRSKGGKLTDTYHQLRPMEGIWGYLRVNLRHAGRVRPAKVHHLVLEAFVGPRPEGMQCRHLDGNNRNNRLDNLRWGTPKENGEDRVRHGTVRGGHRFVSEGVRGELSSVAKLKEKDVILMRRLKSEGMSGAALSRMFHVSETNVSDILRRRTWTHI